MINNTRDIERFRQIAKLYCHCRKWMNTNGKPDNPITIDKFDYTNEEACLYHQPNGHRFFITVDEMLKFIQFFGIYENYSIDRTTSIKFKGE